MPKTGEYASGEKWEAKNYNFAPLPSDEAETLRNSIKGKNKNVTNLIKFIISRFI